MGLSELGPRVGSLRVARLRRSLVVESSWGDVVRSCFTRSPSWNCPLDPFLRRMLRGCLLGHSSTTTWPRELVQGCAKRREDTVPVHRGWHLFGLGPAGSY